ncbi:uncharacterized protein YecE (DUF72 family) [Pedobacter cryoconitis]|uniref:Uncharacterized protein YecE (DUF72 family) n=1 Tax=Pedobacter cryoconitis TaxID=188932 RepID=A0A7W8ZS90_9SPHI|nr:DUF72 domain-containing protein [Pedobacter cryoconitis]MBB5639266.1 uncharacterized protein YecE (DUF72 family) [Pedobacter cryoconitis]
MNGNQVIDWRIGCSGYYYKEWKDIFYPAGLPQKDWFGYYCQHFNTIEINSSFYKQPSLKSFNTWYDQSPADFLFTIKAPRTITHYNKFHDSAGLISDFYQMIKKGLRDKLGCVLFQLPPSFSYTEERLSLLLNNLDPALNNVIEFRHISWWNNTVMTEFKNNQLTFSGLSYPSALPDGTIQFNNPVYYRFHGKPILYKSLYTEQEIITFAKSIMPGTKQVFVYFNNTWGESALTNAKQLIALKDLKL